MTFMERVAPVVDETILALATCRFVENPIAGVRYSRNTSIVSSAYKRHGRILEIALREIPRDSNRHKVWHDDAFRVSRDAADTKAGWDCWGNQVALFDHGPVPTRRQFSRVVEAPPLSP